MSDEATATLPETDQAAAPASAKPKATTAKPKTGKYIDPSEDGAGYLKAASWTPLGDPEHPMTLWLDPAKSVEGEQHEEVKEARNVKGQLRPVMVKDPEGVYVEVKQTVITAPAEPVSRNEALRIQMSRDALAQRQSVKPKAKS